MYNYILTRNQLVVSSNTYLLYMIDGYLGYLPTREWNNLRSNNKDTSGTSGFLKGGTYFIKRVEFIGTL